MTSYVETDLPHAALKHRQKNSVCVEIWLHFKSHLIKLGFLWRIFNHLMSHLRFSKIHKYVPYQLGIILLASGGLLLYSKLDGTSLNEEPCNECGMRKIQLLFPLNP